MPVAFLMEKFGHSMDDCEDECGSTIGSNGEGLARDVVNSSASAWTEMKSIEQAEVEKDIGE